MTKSINIEFNGDIKSVVIENNKIEIIINNILSTLNILLPKKYIFVNMGSIKFNIMNLTHDNIMNSDKLSLFINEEGKF